MKKIYVGISRDHSGSMHSLKELAAADYNQNIAALRDAANNSGQDTIVSVVSCGIGSGVRREIVNSSVNALENIKPGSYICDGQTPLFDSVGELIRILKSMPDAADPDVVFLIMVITDGAENYSKLWSASSLSREIYQLQMSDRWTFAFRVPRGHSTALANLGIPRGNILEWEASDRGIVQATSVSVGAINNYYAQASVGVRASSRFYTDLSSVSPADIDYTLDDITKQVTIYPVTDSTLRIREFIESRLVYGAKYRLGTGFYQLTKPEDVQSYKQIVLQDKQTGLCHGGDRTRQMLGLPTYGTIKVHPGDHGRYDVFVQSTSVNRKLVPGTKVLYWPQVVSASRRTA